MTADREKLVRDIGLLRECEERLCVIDEVRKGIERKCETCADHGITDHGFRKACEACKLRPGYSYWTPVNPQAVEIVGLQTDVETLLEELRRVNVELAAKSFDIKALDLAAEINTATIRNMGDERKRLRNREKALREEIGQRANDYAEIEAHAEHLRKYAGHRERCIPSPVSSGKPCTCGFDEGRTGKDYSAKNISERLDGRSVTIKAHTRGDSDVIEELVGPDQIAKAILNEHGIFVQDIHIDFSPLGCFLEQKLGVWDAKVTVGGYPVIVKVWIVRDAEPAKPTQDAPQLNVMVNQTEILCLLRQVADNAMPLGQSGALRNVVKRCAMMLGKDA